MLHAKRHCTHADARPKVIEESRKTDAKLRQMLHLCDYDRMHSACVCVRVPVLLIS